MISIASKSGDTDGWDRRPTVVIVVSALVVLGMAGVALGPAVGDDTEADGVALQEGPAVADSIVQQNTTQDGEFDSAGTAVTADESEDGASIPEEAFRAYDWGIVPEDTTVEEGDDVRVSITGQDLGGLQDGDGDVVEFVFDIDYDPSELDLQSVETSGIVDVTDSEFDGWEFEHEEPVDGLVTVDWHLDLGLDNIGDLLEQLFDDDGPEDPFVLFDDEELFELVFEQDDLAAEDTTEIDVRSDMTFSNRVDEPTVKGQGLVPGVDVWSEYDSDTIWFGDGEIEIVPESLDPAIEGADGSFEATGTGGYIDFGQPDDPGETADTLVTFAVEDNDVSTPITIEGDYRSEDGQWRADPDDIFFPGFGAGDSNAEIEATFPDGLGGTIDTENGTMTLGGDIRVAVPLLSEDFVFEFETTTATSGELSGDGAFDVDPDSLDGDGSATTVSNEFVVLEDEQEGVDALRQDANLERDGEWVADDPGENYLVFDFDFEFEEFVGEDSTLAGEVVDDSGEPVPNAAVNVLDSPGDDVILEEGGAFELGGLEPGSWDIQVDAEGYEGVEETIEFEPLETVERTFELPAGDTDFAVDIGADEQIADDETLFVRGTVENRDIGVGEQAIELLVDGEVVASETVTLGEDVDDDLTPDTYPTETDLDFEWTPEETGEFDLELRSEDDSASTTVEVVGEDDIEIDAVIDGEAQLGTYVAFGEDSVGSAEEEGLLLPPQEEGDSAISFRAEVVDGEWSASPDAVSFPDFEALGFDAEPDAPLGLEGEIDRESGEMTLEGEFEVAIPDLGATLTFDAETTTGESGEMSGSASFSEDSASVQLVDNEFEVPPTGNSEADDVLEAPLDPGENYLFLDFDLSIQDVDEGGLATGAIEGAVTDESGDALEGITVDVEDSPASAETDSNGEYELTDVDAGTQTLTAGGDAFFEDSTEVDVTEDETATQEFELEAGEAEFDLTVEDDTAIAGESLDVSAIVENEGNAEGEVDLTLQIETADGDTLGETTDSGTLAPEETLSQSLSVLTAESMVGEGTVVLEVNDETAEAAVEIEEPLGEDDGPDALLEATNTGEGYISFDEDNEGDAVEEGLPFPGGEIVIEGEVYGDRWQATAVQFPALDAGIATAEVDADGVSGTIDTDSGEMTLSGDLAVDVVDLEDADAFGFSIDATSGDSGALAGSRSIDEDGGGATLVDNEFTVNADTGSAAVDGALGLPLTDPGLAWIALDLEVEIQEIEGDGPAAGELEGTVTNADGDPIPDATVDVVDDLSEASTDSDGSYRLDRLDAGSYELAVDAAGYETRTVEVEIEDGGTTERTIELVAGDPAFEYEFEAAGGAAGETVTATATVSNTGNGEGTVDVTAALGTAETTETIELAPDETETVTVEWETDDEGSHDAVLSADSETVAETTVEVSEPAEEPDNAVVVDGTGGFVAFGADNESNARDTGIEIPSFSLTAELDEEDGTWVAEPEDISFATVEEPETGVEAEIEPDGQFEGTIDPETGEMTMTGVLDVTTDLGPGFELDLSLTTAESGELVGAGTLDDETGEFTLVDNAFAVGDSGDGVVDDQLRLPSDSGESWIELDASVSLVGEDEANEQESETEQENEESSEEETNGDDGEVNTTNDDESFVTELGLWGGVLGGATAVTAMFVAVAGRVIRAADPDPGP